MATLILGALDEEIAACRSNLVGRRDTRWHAYELTSGGLGGSRVAVAGTGVGKTMAALATQHWIDSLEPERVIFIGTAAAVNPSLSLGDVIVAADALQYDLDAVAAGFALGQVPFTEYRHIASDPRLVAAALSYRPEGFAVVRGRALTGDRVLAKPSNEQLRYLVSELGGDVVDMEGASAGLVCLVNRVPFLLIRVVSDRADSKARSDFGRMLPLASRRARSLIEHVLKVVEGTSSQGGM